MGFSFFGQPPEPAARPDYETIVTELVGRPHSAKSTLVDRTIEVLLQRVLPSGLSFRVADPRQLTEWLRDLDHHRKRSHRTGRLSTTTTQQLTWLVCEGSDIKASLQIRDRSGQVLTQTRVEGTYLEELAREYRSALPKADVIWQFLPCIPKDHTNEDLHRFRNDVSLTSSYIHEALDQRETNHPIALAVVVPRIDTRFDSVQAARELFPAELLQGITSRLRALTSRHEITEVRLFPLTTLGFGTTVTTRPREADADAFTSLTFGESDWLLKEDALPKPVNVLPLLVWTLLAGLRQRVVNDSHNIRDIVHLCRVLAADLDSLNGFHYCLKDD